jgi:tRNA U34 2-thiouridine synthase MnmA/TrmU
MKAIVLFSGGLDSILAACLLKSQGVEVVGLNMVTPFHDCSKESIERAKEIGIELVVRHFGEEYMQLLARPKWGYGANVNPCLDCRVAMCREAKKLMEEIGAGFVATGEVSGQRPNSQKMHQLALISRESELGGKLVRPLSARVLPRTEMEAEGKLDREKLRSFTGRSRTKLVAYARQAFGLKTIPQPSTGCVLCENSYAPRVRDMLKHKENPTIWDAKALAWGRRLRIDENAYCVVGRRLTDCQALDALFADPARSRCVLLSPDNYMGASVLLVTDEAPEFGVENPEISEKLESYIQTAGALSLRFSNPEKYSSAPGGPACRVYVGATKILVPVREDPEADKIAVIMEANEPEKKKEAKPDEAPESAPAEDASERDSE